MIFKHPDIRTVEKLLEFGPLAANLMWVKIDTNSHDPWHLTSFLVQMAALIDRSDAR